MTGMNSGVGKVNKKETTKSEQTQSLQNPLLNPETPGFRGAKSTGIDYDVNLSPQAKQMAEARAKAFDIAKNTPEVREEKVAELKKRIQSGNYQVDSTKVADGMMREAIMQALTESEDLG